MIKASELRIGNAIWDDTHNKIKWVTHRVISDLASHPSPLPCSPIPLTPEWMGRCGFSKEPNDDSNSYETYSTLKMEGGIAQEKDGWYFRIIHIDGYYEQRVGREIENVHQLQNLYFALTGEELTINHA